MKIISPFPELHETFVQRFYLESDGRLTFSFKQKLYYLLIRKILPVRIRQLLQHLLGIGSSVLCREDFICPEFAELVVNLGYQTSNLLPAHPTIVLTHDVEEAAGYRFIPEVVELELKFGFRSSFNLVPYKYPIDTGIIRELRDNNFEIGIHGYNHDGKLYLNDRIFRKRAYHINEALKRHDACGFRSPMAHRNLAWLQQLDILYDSSCFDYDPFQQFPGGTGSIWPFIAGKFVELPYTLPQDHVLFLILRQRDIGIWKRKIDWLVHHNGMILVLTHPDYLLMGNFLSLYEELLNYLTGFKTAARLLPRELAELWKQTYDKN